MFLCLGKVFNIDFLGIPSFYVLIISLDIDCKETEKRTEFFYIPGIFYVNEGCYLMRNAGL